MRASVHTFVLCAAALWACEAQAQAPKPFQLEEASIEDIHAAIRAGQTTCAQIVQGYVARARAYNGVCTALITPDGADVPAATGTTRAGAPLKFPTGTVAATDLFPDFAKYKGDVPDFGRMEPTMSDPDRVAAVRHGRRHPERGAGQRARDAEHSRRAFGDLQRRIRRAPVDRSAAGRRAGGVRRIPQAARRARNGRGARRASTAGIPISTPCRCTAWRWLSRPSTTRRTCAPRAAAT